MSNETKQHIHDKINEKAQEYESATQHEGLGPAIFKDGVAYAMAYAKVEADKSLQKEHQELKEKAERNEKALKEIQAEHADLNLALAAMLNGYQNLSMYQKDWFTVPKDLINTYTKMVLEYDTSNPTTDDIANG